MAATASGVTSNNHQSPSPTPPPPPNQANTSPQATPTALTSSASQGSTVPQTASNEPQSPSFITSLVERLCKDLSPLNIITTILAAVALLYGAKSYNESARANDLATRESCRQHPNNSALQATSVCQSMRNAHDFDRTSKREISLMQPESWEWLPQEEHQWSMVLEPFLLCIISLCLWRAAGLVVDEGSRRPASMSGFLVALLSRSLIFLLMFAFAWGL